jgi:hypothetical protein
VDALREFVQQTDGLAAINVIGLPRGTKLLVHTRNSLYEVRVVDGQHVDVFGGTLPEGGVRFPSPTPAFVTGATQGGPMIWLGRIAKGMNLEFGLSGRRIVTTSPVQEVTVESPDGDWSYTMGWRTASPTA